MPTQLYKNEAIDFICARDFTYAGVDHKTGTDFDQDIDPGRLEMLVRTRRIIPVIDEYDDKPRHWYREVQLRKNVLAKLKSRNYGSHPETKVWKDEETHKVGRQGTPTDVGDATEYEERFPSVPTDEEIRDESQELWQARQDNIDEEEDMGKQKVTLVNGKEESEPVAMLGLDEPVEETEVEYKTVDEPELEWDEDTQALIDGEADPADRETVDPIVDVKQNEEDGEFDPSKHTVDEVNEHLESADEAERERVLSAEEDGKGRKGILGDG